MKHNETWPADTFQSRQFLVEQGNVHAAMLPNGEFIVLSASQEAVLMVVCFIYAKSKNAKQV